MRSRLLVCLACAFAALFIHASVFAADAPQFPSTVTFTTLVQTPLSIEGLTADATGKLYTTGRATATPCPVWQINPANPALEQIGSIPAGCNASGIALDRLGNIYIADAASGGRIWRLTAANMNPTVPFATGVPGTNGLAFDRFSNLWTGDGTTGFGRVWRISGAGANCSLPFGPANPCEEVFRIQPMRNGTDLGGGVAAPGVGRTNSPVPTGAAQNLVANGLAFNQEGELFNADTARGAIWKVQLNADGSLRSPTGCDTTFSENTLCLSNIFVAHPLLEGTDGIALDRAGNLWNSVNERNAIVVVTRDGSVKEIFRNPVNANGLRNSADPSVGNHHILEFPTSPVPADKVFCTANSDGDRRDNSPNTGGELAPTGPFRGKISCMDQPLIIQGLPLPIR